MNEKAKFYGVPLSLEAGENITAGSVPFYKASLSPNHRPVVGEFMQTQYDTAAGKSYCKIPLNTACDGVYFFGMINSNDIGSGSWYTAVGEHIQDFFAGDSIGEVNINYMDGVTETIPLLIGFAAWWYRPWAPEGQPFASGLPRRELEESLFLQDVFQKCHGGYCLPYRPRTAVIGSIEVTGNPAKSGYPLFYGLTLANPQTVEQLRPLGEAPLPAYKHIDSAVLRDTKGISQRVEKVMRHLYTFEDELPAAEEIAFAIPENYHWPVLKMQGSALAKMLSNQYMNVLGQSIMPGANGSCAAIGAYGGSADFSHRYKECIGLYHDGSPAGGTYWTRDLARIYIERMRGGDPEAGKRGLDFYARALYGHGSFVPGPRPHWVQDYIENPAPGQAGGHGFSLGLKTLTTGEKIEGNLENDGHGLIMLAMMQYYIAGGQDNKWLEANRQVLADAAEWFCYQMDNPLDVHGCIDDRTDYYHDYARLQAPGLIFSENESACYGSCDTWNNGIAYYALVSAAILFERLDEKKLQEKYMLYADRLLQAMKEHLTEMHPPYGRVWKYFYRSSWQDFNETLAPVICAYDVYGLDTDKIDPETLEITRNTYQMLIHRGKDGGKYYNYTRAYGYGQSFIMEGALLLDEAEDFEKLAQTASWHMYSKREHPWLCAEGSIAHESGRYWFRHNGIGNEVQVASFIRVIRIMLGIDDFDTETLVLRPRIPQSFLPVSLENYMVQAKSGGRLQRCTIGYTYDKNGGRTVFTLRSDQPMDRIRLWLPAPEGAKVWAEDEKGIVRRPQYSRRENSIVLEGLKADTFVKVIIE